MEMTRQRHSESVHAAVYDDCPYCKGRGKVKSALTMSVEIQRKLERNPQETSARRIRLPIAHRGPSDRPGTSAHRRRKTSHRDGKTLFRQTLVPRRTRASTPNSSRSSTSRPTKSWPASAPKQVGTARCAVRLNIRTALCSPEFQSSLGPKNRGCFFIDS